MANKTEIELVTRPSWFQVAEAIRKEVRNEKREGGGVTGGAKHAGDNGGFVVVVIGNKTDSLPRAVDSTQVGCALFCATTFHLQIVIVVTSQTQMRPPKKSPRRIC